jgi:hypothetical protein
VPFSITTLPGRNFKVAGFGVASVWMNMSHSVLPGALLDRLFRIVPKYRSLGWSPQGVIA